MAADNPIGIEIQAQVGKAIDSLDKIVEILSHMEKSLNGVFGPLKRIDKVLSNISGTKLDLKIDTKSIDEATKKLEKLKGLEEAAKKTSSKKNNNVDVGETTTVDTASIDGAARKAAQATEELGEAAKNAAPYHQQLSQRIKELKEELGKVGTDANPFLTDEDYEKAMGEYSNLIAKKKEWDKVISERSVESSNTEIAVSARDAAAQYQNIIDELVKYQDLMNKVNRGQIKFANDEEYKRAMSQYTYLTEAKRRFDEEIKKQTLAAFEPPKGLVEITDQLQKADSQLQEYAFKLNEYKYALANYGKPGKFVSTEQFAEAKMNIEEVKQKYEDLLATVSESKPSGDMELAQEMRETAESVVEVKDYYQDLASQIQEYRKTIKDFDKGLVPEADFEKAQTELPALEEELERYKQQVKEASKGLDDEEFANSADHIKSKIEEIIEKIRQYKETIRGMEGGKITFDKSMYDEAVAGLPQAEKALADYKAKLAGVQEKSKPANKGINAWRALATAVNTVTRSMNALGDAGIRALKVLSKPLVGIGQSIKKSIGGVAKSFQDLGRKASKPIKKLTSLWELFTRKFRNYLIFKFISQIIKGFSEAVQSLAQFSNETGTLFNDSISNLIADFAEMSRAILAVVEPIINKVVPIFDALAAKINEVSNVIAQFFAALGGQGYAMKAKKKVDNYAESLDKASKKAKNLKQNLLGIDELNVINTKEDDEDEKGYMDEWEITPIDPAILDFADKIRQKFQDLLDWLKQNFGALWDDLFGDFDLIQFAKDLFKPILEAWELTKDKLGESFAHLVNSLGWLFKDMADDFMEVWSQVDTRKIFENILNAIADIMEGIARLADNFREAWNFNDTGKKILEDIRDIIKIITEWIAKAAAYFKEWAKDVDFKPLLTSFERLLQSLKKIADFVMHELYDIFTIVILGWAKFLIEEGLPLLNEQFKKIADGFPAEKVQKNLEKIWKAIERLGEEIFKGVALAIGDIGDMFNKFLDSERFEKFVDTIVTVMKKIDSEDVRKIIDGVAIAIGDLATALIDFVNSEQFMAFIDKLDRWLANASAQDIADILKKVAAAILLFKFAGFVGPGVTAFLTFVGALKRLDITGPIGALQKLAPGVTSISGVVSSAVKGFGSFISVLGEMTSGIPLLSGALTGLGSVLTFLAPLIGVVFVGAMAAAGIALIATGGDVAKATDIINQGIEKLKNIDFKAIFDSIASTLASWVNKLFEVLANIDWKGVWDTIVNLLLGLVSGIATLIADIDWSNVVSALVQCVIGLFASVITHLPEILVTIVELAFALGSALIEAFIGVFKGLYESFKSIGGDIIGGIFKGIMDAIVGLGKWLKEHIFDPIVDGIKKLFGIASPSKVMAEIGGYLIEGLIEGMSNLINNVFEVISAIVDGIKKLFEDGVEAIKQVWNGITEFFSVLWTTVGQIFTSAWEILKGIVSAAWEAIKAVWNGVTEFFSSIWNGVTEIFSAIWSTLSDIVVGAWMIIKSAWSEVTQFFSNILSGLSSIFTSVWNAIGQIVANAWNFIQSIWNGAVEFFNNLISEIQNAFDAGVNAIKECWNSLWTAIQNAWNGAVKFFADIVEGIRKAFDDGVKAIQKFFEDAWNFIKGVWDKAKQWFTDLVNNIKDAFDKGIQAIKEFWNKLWQDIQSLWKDAVKWFTDIIKSIQDAFDKGIEAIQKFWSELWSDIEKIWDSAVKWFTDIVNAIGKAFESGIKDILKFWTDLWKDIENVWNKAGDFFNNILNKIHDFFDKALENIAKLWDNLWKTITKVWETAKEWFSKKVSDILTGIKEAFGRGLAAMGEIGINLIKGIAEGMMKGIGAFGNIVKAIKDYIVNKFKEFFKIHSPSQVMADEVGGFLTAGLFEGMEDEADGTNAWLKQSFTDPILNGIRDLFGIHSPSTAMAEIGSYLVQGLGEGLSGESKAELLAIMDGILEEIKTKCSDTWIAIQEMWSVAPEWFSTTIFEPILTMVTESTETIGVLITDLCTLVQTVSGDTWIYIQEIWQGAVEWFRESVITPLVEMVTEACETIKALADEVLEKIGEVIENIKSLIYEVIEVVNEVCESIRNQVNDLITELTDVITQAFETLKAQVLESSELIREQAAETCETVKELALEAWEYVKSIWEVAPQWFEEVLIEVVSVFEKKLQEIADLWQANWDFIAQLWINAIQWFDETLEEIKSIFETKLEEIKPFWQDLWDFIEQLWTDAIPWFEDIMQQISQMFEDALNAITELWQANWDSIEEIWNAASDYFDEIITSIAETFTEKLEEIAQLWQDLWDSIEETWSEAVSFFEDIVEQIVDAFNQGNEAIEEGFGALFEGITEKANGMFKNILEMAKSMAETIKGLMNNISSQIDGVIAKANEAKKIAGEAGAKVSTSTKSTTTSKSTSKSTNNTTTTGDSKIDALFEKANNQLAGIKESLSKASDSNQKAQESLEKAQDAQTQQQEKEVSILSKATTAVSRALGFNVPAFATGGFPENGMFFANNSELVGRFTNGRTAVANNEQIVQGISNGVEQAITNSLAGYLIGIENNQKAQMNQKTSITLDGRELVGALDSRKSRNGFSFT